VSSERWLHQLLCLDATDKTPALKGGCPHPSECELYYVERDTLFSHHKAAEDFLQVLQVVWVWEWVWVLVWGWVWVVVYTHTYICIHIFLQGMMSLYVSSHYKNSPNDLQLLSDAPGTQFTCFTSTRVQILTPAELRASAPDLRASWARQRGRYRHP